MKKKLISENAIEIANIFESLILNYRKILKQLKPFVFKYIEKKKLRIIQFKLPKNFKIFVQNTLK